MKNRHRFLRSSPVVAAFAAAITLGVGAPEANAGSVFGVDVADYIILYEGNAGKKLDISNFGFDGIWTGDIGIATGPTPPSGTFHMAGGTLKGDVDFAAANSGQATIDNSATVSGTVNYSVGGVNATMNALNTLSSTLGAKSGTNIAINTNGLPDDSANTSQTVLASLGAATVIDGNTYRVFNVTSFTTNNGEDLIIKADSSSSVAGVVFNINLNDIAFKGNVYLEDLNHKFYGQDGYTGLTPDQVLFNLYGGGSLVGVDDLSVNNQGTPSNPHNIIYATFLDPNGQITLNKTRIVGRIFGGDTSDMKVTSESKISLPKLGVPEPGTLALALLGVVFVLRSRVRRPSRGRGFA